MNITLYKEYVFGDMTARYITDEKEEKAGLLLIPSDMAGEAIADKKQYIDSLVQIKLAGDAYLGSFAQGHTLRNGESVKRLKLKEQTEEQNGNCITICTLLEDERNYRVYHYLSWKKGDRFLRCWCKFENAGKEEADIEMISSFSLGGLSPFLEGDGEFHTVLHRLRSRWSQEGRHEVTTFEEMQMESSWTLEAVRAERFGQVGSMPVNHYFPFAAIEDTKNHIYWGAQLAHPASWQMEVYRREQDIAFSGGLADREFGHWMKRVAPGEMFETPQSILTVCKTESFDLFTARLTEAGKKAADHAPEAEQSLPIVFNEYCTTWGNPSHENIVNILKNIKDCGFTYFVIDCGWYKENDVPWSISMGDYEPSVELFPQGLDKTVDIIKAAGLKPGIWFEIENVGEMSKAYNNTEHLLHRDGRVLTTHLRRFWDMQDPWVDQYLTERVIGTLKHFGFEYMKIDYNDTIGIGCDGAESLGEGLRRNMEGTKRFFKKIKQELPDIVLENCASGGHRLEPGFMALTSMASFSDAHECEEIPIIAANLHWAILPRQSQIWAVIRKTDSLKRIAYSVAATFLGRMCISGDVTELSDAQWNTLQRGIDFYKKVSSIIKEGQSYRYGTEIKSDRHPDGWQAVVRVENEDRALAVIHTFNGEMPETIEIALPPNCPRHMIDLYTDDKIDITVVNERVIYKTPCSNRGSALLLGSSN